VRGKADAYAETLERYRDAFGEPPAEMWISDDVPVRAIYRRALSRGEVVTNPCSGL
jgi:hypothetical protein